MLFASFAIVSLLLSGCVQSSAPQSCTNMSQEEAGQCTYRAAVLEQNPFYCYSIAELDLREECMKHASDPAMKKKLERSGQQSAPAQPQAPPALPPAPPQVPENAQCANLTGIPRDECLLERSTLELDMQLCTTISDASARQVCISRVAQATRDLESCDSFADEGDAAVCRAYAGGQNP